ncbi:aldo/keto reductase [Adlercreutzia sp. ZJ304]|uniref:aldo/keto reductase family protein n=1 Tax=Adlercreutzia sp. ZJ304 TaxID=2709791 RepID=UPI0013E9E6EE|nr:aldo/keto reductase [Adlercreutzia sp. ZJ304]
MKAIFGTMNIGQQVFVQDAIDMLGAFKSAGGTEIDTAYVYNDGACESLLGECFKSFDISGFSVATKANPRVTGTLDRASVVMQLNESLIRMDLKSVDVFYLHFPDRSTPIGDAIEGCVELYSEGKFKELGVSNFPLELIEEMIPICEKLGCPRPTVFEGVYNVLSRNAESELFPYLDSLGMRFYAYNPLAGGMLTGKYEDINTRPNSGRFALRAKSYQGRYWKESYFEAIVLISEACKLCNISVAEAAYRWLANHSMLNKDRGDGVIVGASSMSQLKQNLDSLNKLALPSMIVEAMDSAWGLTAKDSPEYYRFYSDGKVI